MGKNKNASDKKSIRKQKQFATLEEDVVAAARHWAHIMQHRGTFSIEKEADALGDLSFAAWRARKCLLKGTKQKTPLLEAGKDKSTDEQLASMDNEGGPTKANWKT